MERSVNTLRSSFGFSIYILDLDAENISRDYLQGLFGSFSFTKAGGGEVQDADTSDGEYQIYEQDSLGEYSDDDDY